VTVVQLQKGQGGSRGPVPDKSSLIAAIDVGSTKVCCLIAERKTVKSRTFGGERKRELKVLGFGHQEAHGIRGGAVVNLDDAERSIRLAVDAAERMSGKTAENVYVNVSGGRPTCTSYNGHYETSGDQVSSEDVARVIERAQEKIEPGKRVVLHTTPTEFALDQIRNVNDPRGMFGDALSVRLNAVSVERGPMRNLAMVIGRCHLDVAGFVIAPYAAGRSVLVDDELEMGVTCIDLGGETSTVSVFSGGNLVFADSIPIGGQHITMDIARGLSTPVAHAERMKTYHGSALPAVCDDREFISVPMVGEIGTDTVNKIPRSMLTGIIQPRLEETFELIVERLRKSGMASRSGRRMVITGGASQMTGVRELAASMLDRQVRFGFPNPVTGMPDAARNPAFAVAAGLLDYALNPDQGTVAMPDVQSSRKQANGYFGRVGSWIKESF
jgi:cell division protein FtsA